MKALFEHTMLPRVLAGSSVGSIVAGIVGTRTDDELRETFRKLDNIELSFFNNKRAVELVHSFLQKGALHDMSYLQVRAGGSCCPKGTVQPATRLPVPRWLSLTDRQQAATVYGLVFVHSSVVLWVNAALKGPMEAFWLTESAEQALGLCGKESNSSTCWLACKSHAHQPTE